MVTFLHSALWSGLVTLVIGMLPIGLIMWAESRAEAPEKQETRKLRRVGG